ncbi:MAG: hypothetical protein ABW221_02045 [Vicinamibacteria bacterium]
MNRLAFVVALACATPVAAQQVVSYPAGGEQVAPVYINAEVVRVDRSAGTLTFKSESGQTVLTTEGDALSGLGGLRAGDNVILSYRETSAGARIVTGIRPASTTSGEPGPRRTVAVTETTRTTTKTPARTVVTTTAPRAVVTAESPNAVVTSEGIPLSAVNTPIPSIPPATSSVTTSLPASSVPPQAMTPAQVAANRAIGIRNFDAAVAVTAATASQVDRAWAAHRTLCVEGTEPVNALGREWFAVLDGSMPQPTEGQCGQSYAEVARLAHQFKAQLDTARETARRSEVLPGDMRESLQRYNVDL